MACFANPDDKRVSTIDTTRDNRTSSSGLVLCLFGCFVACGLFGMCVLFDQSLAAYDRCSHQNCGFTYTSSMSD
jgi:hypothetical protein